MPTIGWKSFAMLLLVILTSSLLALAMQPSQDIDQRYEQYYIVREQHASSEIRVRLMQHREVISKKHLSFRVGYTTAMRYDLKRIAGTKPPANLLELARKQNQESQTSPGTKQHDSRKPSSEAPCIVTREKWDWRSAGKVTRIRDQADCGACWAFGTAGALESSYQVRHPGTSVDLSEQQILSCSGVGSCDGGWWAFDYSIKPGITTEGAYPYDAAFGPCVKGLPVAATARNWKYVDIHNGVAEIGLIKEALCEHGPVVAAVNSTPLFQSYTGGVFDEHDLGTKEQPVNHAVLIIGWDDTKHAWLIKNSWGLGWGDVCGLGTERGYMWIQYGSNNIGYGAAWVDVN